MLFSSLLLAYSEDRFEADYAPTVFDNIVRDVIVSGEVVQLNLWVCKDDTTSKGNY